MEAKPLNIFIRTSRNNTPLRQAMYELTRARWEMENVKVTVLKDVGIRNGRQFAEEWAKSDPYIYTDDDVLIIGKRWVERGTEAILNQPEYAVASTLSLIETENAAVAPPGTEKGRIYPMHAVGAPMWIRKGVLVEMPEMDLGSECSQIYNYVLSLGRKEGLIHGIRHNHLGHGFSSNPLLHWGF